MARTCSTFEMNGEKKCLLVETYNGGQMINMLTPDVGSAISYTWALDNELCNVSYVDTSYVNVKIIKSLKDIIFYKFGKDLCLQHFMAEQFAEQIKVSICYDRYNLSKMIQTCQPYSRGTLTEIKDEYLVIQIKHLPYFDELENIEIM